MQLCRRITIRVQQALSHSRTRAKERWINTYPFVLDSIIHFPRFLDGQELDYILQNHSRSTARSPRYASMPLCLSIPRYSHTCITLRCPPFKVQGRIYLTHTHTHTHTFHIICVYFFLIHEIADIIIIGFGLFPRIPKSVDTLRFWFR